ncbi:hypothetical protein ADK41_07215 [Streptomyces caelestis]|uniref:Uncharacterized protein n=1 Tax=Streptomyces caelestis TaxID=36816 RepID=A0A0M8QUL2_9ACTN|nr:hypothetical protein ADK41_07215 [Streptomyces caelestis]KOV29963.1 hypothetical protein ADK58_08790 [Streptomyces sp. XY152]
MASSSPPSVDRDEGAPPLRRPSAERAYARAAGPDGALPRWAGGSALHGGAPSPRQGSGHRRDPRDRRCAGSAVRVRA